MCVVSTLRVNLTSSGAWKTCKTAVSLKIISANATVASTKLFVLVFEMVLFAVNCLFKIKTVIKMSNELYPELKQTKQDFILSATITL